MDDLTPIDETRRRQLATARLVPQHRLDRQGYEHGDFWLGRTLNGHPFGWHEDLNLLTCAGPRSGKGVGTVIPNLMLFPGSAVVIDPKGELASLTAEHREKVLGQKVIVLDPAGTAKVPPEMRGTFNPLAHLDPEDPRVVAEAAAIASALVVKNPKATDPFWDVTAHSYIQAVILYMVHFYAREKRTMMMLRQTASIGDWDLYQAFLQHMREGPDGDPTYEGSPTMAFELMQKEMFASDAFGGLLREAAVNMSKYSENTKGNILGGLTTHLDFLKDPILWPALADGSEDVRTFELADLRNQDQFTTIYICLPVDMMAEQGRWMRVLVSLITRYAQRTEFNKETDQPILMMIDEFFQLGPLPSIENTLTYAPGFGLRLWLIVQDIGQLKKNYPESWETILGACGIKQFFGINDLQTAKFVSELLGDEEIDLPSVSLTHTESDTDGSNSSSSVGSSRSSSSSSSWSQTSGSSTSYAPGKTWYEPIVTTSTSSSRTSGGSSSDNVSANQSTTTGTSRSRTSGQSKGYTITKKERRLLRPEEVITSFTKQNLVQLLHVRDHGGMMLIRTPYFSDPYLQSLEGAEFEK